MLLKKRSHAMEKGCKRGRGASLTNLVEFPKNSRNQMISESAGELSCILARSFLLLVAASLAQLSRHLLN